MSTRDFTSHDEAKKLAGQYHRADPFADDEIAPSLLSAADILRYVDKTGMVCPFDPKKLKTASYEIRPAGSFIYWEKQDGEIIPHDIPISNETKSITFPANSISYIQSEAYFRLPLYIAVRFNLRIKHVHRGILLGTGPIVDPGFSGRLLIPIHNLTSEPYELNLISSDDEDGLIWAEFTKTTFVDTKDREIWSEYRTEPVSREETEFDSKKIDKSPKYYLHEANGGNPILSSIHDAVAEAKSESAKSAQAALESAASSTAAEGRLRNIGLIASIGVAVGLVSLLIATCSLTTNGYNVAQGSLGLSQAAQRDLADIRTGTQKRDQSIEGLSNQLRVEEAETEHLALKVDALERALVSKKSPSQAGSHQ